MAQVLSAPNRKHSDPVKNAKQRRGRPAKVLSLPNQGRTDSKKREEEQVAVISMLILM